MNILEAYELAKAGKTVIAPDGTECRHLDFDRTDMFMHSYVFGEWKEKREPRVYWANDYGTGGLFFHSTKELADKASEDRIACVRFIEVIDEA